MTTDLRAKVDAALNDIDGFAAWLDRPDAPAEVGTAGDGCRCPVHTYLVDVTGCGDYDVVVCRNRTRDQRMTWRIPHPSWLSLFIYQTDARYVEESITCLPVPTVAARAILAGIRGKR